MAFVKLKQLGKKAKDIGSKNSHIISGGIAIVGVVVTAVCAYKARPKMDRIMEDKQEKMDELDESVEIPEEEYKRVKREIVWETMKEAAPVMAPTVLAGSVTIGAMIFSVASGTRKIADATSLATAYSIAHRELYDKTKEVVGEEKAQEIKEKVAEDRFKKQFKTDNLSDEEAEEIYQLALQARGGNQLYYDPHFGSIFKSDDDTIVNVCDELVRDLRRSGDMEDYKSYNDFAAYMMMPQTKAGEDYALAYYEDLRSENSLEFPRPMLLNTLKLGKRSVVILEWEVSPILVKELEEIHRKWSS